MMDGGGFVDQYDREDDRYQRPRFDNGADVDDSYRHRDSSTGKLFVGGIAWETTRERFTDYFCKYGEVTDAIIMMDKFTGKPRGFGFVTFADPAVADKVLQEDHVMDGRTIEVKRTVPREEMPARGAPPRTRKLFVGGLIPTLTEDELKEYFSSFGHVVEHQIMFDHETGRSRSFGFVTFENEDDVERILSDGRVHELGGRPVEIKRALPKRFGGEYGNEHSGGGSVSKPYGGYKSGANEYQGGYSGGKMGRGYDEYGNYGAYVGNYGGGAGFYGGYGGGYGGGGYGYGFWGPMYGSAAGGVYGGNMYGGYGGGSGGYAGGVGGFGGGKGYGGKGYGAGGSATGRYHPYQK